MSKRMLIPMLVLSLGITASLPSYAQNSTDGTDRTVTRVDNDRDWGWLGLLGLAGLLGLKRRRPDSYTTTTKASAAR